MGWKVEPTSNKNGICSHFKPPKTLGGLLGALWEVSWGPLEPSQEPPAPSWEPLAASGGPLGGLLGASWVHREAPRAPGYPPTQSEERQTPLKRLGTRLGVGVPPSALGTRILVICRYSIKI